MEGRKPSDRLCARAQKREGLISSLNAIDDALFRKVAEDKDAIGEILRVALGDESLTVEEVVPQRALGSLGVRAVVLDALCRLGDGTLAAVEVQKRDDDDHPRRVRYVRSSVDTYVTEKGTRFGDVPRVAVVFLSRFDPFGGNIALYHVDRVVRETGRRVDDGTEDVYINGESDDGSAAARLMAYMLDSQGASEEFPALSDRVRYYKQSGEGRVEMNDLIEEYAREVAEEGMLRSIKSLMTKLGLSADAAMDVLDVPQDDRDGYRVKLAEQQEHVAAL